MSEQRVVPIPGSFSRRAAPALLAVLFLLPATLVWALGGKPDWFHIVLYGAVALGFVWWAWRVRRQPVLVLDEVGIRDAKGTLLIAWPAVALVWFGDNARWLPDGLRSSSLQVWDDPALAFAERTGFPPHPKVTKGWVPTSLSGAEGAELIRRFTTAPVHTGDGADLRRLVTRLRQTSRR